MMRTMSEISERYARLAKLFAETPNVQALDLARARVIHAADGT